MLRKISIAWIAAIIAMTPVLVHAADEKVVPQSKAEILSFAPVVKKAAPAVVNIYTRSSVQVMENASPFMNDPFFKQFMGKEFVFGGRPREQVTNSLGSGVIISPSGFIVTSHHVIKDAQKITVVLSDKREFDAKVVAKDPQVDLAFLKIDVKDPLPYLQMRDSDSLEVGDLVLAIGNPFGVGQTVTNGIVSALARKAVGVSDYQFFIQTDAAINPGNSGGALIDMNGKLVGINTAIYSRSGGSQGIGFAIPSNMVKSILSSRVEGGRVVHPWLGIAVQPVTHEIAESLGMKVPEGVIVKVVYPDSPAMKSGIKAGDVMLTVNENSISNEHDLEYRLALAKIGEKSSFKLLQDGKEKTVDVELTEPPEQPARDLRKLKGHHPLDGITVANLSPALAAELGIEDVMTGVVVVNVGNSVVGVSIGLAPRDIILQINDTKVTSTSQLESLMKATAHGCRIVYQRGNSVLDYTVKM